ncbi:excalibur calcium-binding domain-containing protein [Actinoplanes sp. NPDC051861]|uniref:excalibur calcium-binding domain-containing protein n=1 Tax=Actinoplanes sp. NPDC051861 TaxID=3155170 RepID=UPI003441EECA
MTQPPQDPWAHAPGPVPYVHGQPPPQYPTAMMPPTPAPPPSKWKRWHKVTLGVLGGLLLFFCGVAIASPPPAENNEKDAEKVALSSPAPVQQIAEEVKEETAAPETTSPKPVKTTPPSPPVKPVVVSYANCSEVRAAGKAPIRTGDPGFRTKFDRDGDGKGCELNGDDAPRTTAPKTTEPEPEPDTDPRFRTCGAANDAGYGPYVQGKDPEYDWYQDRDGDGVVCER